MRSVPVTRAFQDQGDRASPADPKARIAEATPRVVVVIAGVEDFGIRTFLLTQFHHAAEAGIRFSYLTSQDGDCAKALRAAGASVHVAGGQIPWDYPGHPLLLPLFWLSWLPSMYRTYVGIRRFLQGAPCDVLYAHCYEGLAIGRLAARGLNCRTFCHMHSDLDRKRLAGLQRILASLVLAALADRLVAISDFVAASLWGPARKKACRIYNGIDVQSIMAAAQGVAKNPHRIVIVGRLQARKKQQVAIRAIKILHERGIDCDLEIIGGRGPASDGHRRALRDLIETLAVADRVRFAGVVSPPYRRVAAAAACVSCATREPFGLAVIEAAACGTAVVAADAGATAELIEDRKTGLLFRPDDPVALADSLELLLRDRTLCDALSDAARRRAQERYDIAGHLGELRCCFDAVLARP